MSPFYPHCAPFLLSVVSYDPQFCLCRFTPRGNRGRQCSITPIDGSTAPLRRDARALSLVPQVWPRPSLWPDFTESMSHPWLQFSVIRGSLQNAELQLHLKMFQDAPHPPHLPAHLLLSLHGLSSLGRERTGTSPELTWGPACQAQPVHCLLGYPGKELRLLWTLHPLLLCVIQE